MKTAAIALLLLYSYSTTATADLVAFGSGADQFTMEFVSIGNPGNAADTVKPHGSVAYVYNMGKFEVSRDMVTKANSAGGLGISLNDMTSFGGNGVNRPATGVSWNEAARFINWLNTSAGSTPAYKFALQPGDAGYSANANIQLWTISDAGFNAANPFRNSQAHYFLPSLDEWYKAAYYNPTGGFYYLYSTSSNGAPTPVASGTTVGTAVYNGQSGPADITLAGGLSPYGTMGQGGNAFEWQETEYDFVNDSSSSDRSVRGGFWDQNSAFLLSQHQDNWFPTGESVNLGFRVAASVPEPSPLLYGGVVAVGLLVRRWLAS